MRLTLTQNFVRRKRLQIGALVLLAFALDVAAAVGMSYLAGFTTVRARLNDFHPIWLAGVAGGLALSFAFYYLAYREIYRTDSGPAVRGTRLVALVAAGFGGFFAHGGGALDQFALESTGADEREAKVRVTAMAGLEHGGLGIVGTGAATAALVMAVSRPPLDFQYPWAVIPLPGMLLAFWLANRYAPSLRERKGIKGKIGIFADSIVLIRDMFRDPRHHWAGPTGMTAFWLAELFAAWSGLAAFGLHMNAASYIVGFLTAAVFTRRTGPLAGAGVLMVTLSVTLWYSGAPFAAAVLGMFAYRMVSFWLPLPFSLASLPTLRAIGDEASTEKSGQGEPAIEQGQQRQAG